MQQPNQPAKTRLIELDVLRFVAIFLVLGRHLHVCAPETSKGAAVLSNLWATGGWIGVDIFFVLSGFLVSGLLFREYDKYSSVNVTKFLMRRGFKIYPPFWFLMAVTLMVGWIGYPEVRMDRAWSDFVFLQNYSRGMWDHTWSLAIEEHFYLLLAGTVAFLIFLKRPGGDPLEKIPLLFLVTAFVCFTLRFYTNRYLPYSDETHLFPTHLRIDSLMFGVFLSYSWNRNGFVRSTWVRQRASELIGGGILLMLPAFFYPLETSRWLLDIGLVSFYAGSGAILIGLLHRGLPNNWIIRSLALLGAYSYSIYLWHMPVHNWFVPAVLEVLPAPLEDNWFIYLAVFITGSFATGVFMAKLIESPVLSLRDRWLSSRTQMLASQAPQVPVQPIKVMRRPANNWQLHDH